MNGDLFWNLLAKKLSGEASFEEAEELERLLKAHPELAFPARYISDLWAIQSKPTSSEAETAFEKQWLRVKKQETVIDSDKDLIRSPRQKKRIMPLLFLAVAIALGGWFAFQSQKAVAGKPDSHKAEIYSRPGNRTRQVLPDSSVVWLNAGSKLTCDPDFGASNRNTTLIGEAFFDVKKSSLPFIIHAHGVQIKVLGTAFNVKSYPGEQTTETSLIRGRVEVTLEKRPGELIILKPNEKLIVANEGQRRKASVTEAPPIVVLKELTHLEDNTVAETSWVNNKLIFQDESFSEVARKMERWYNVSIDIADEKLAALRVGGGPFENETVEQALAALQIAFNFKFSQKGSQITITE